MANDDKTPEGKTKNSEDLKTLLSSILMIILHSLLTQRRIKTQVRNLFRFVKNNNRIQILVTLSIQGGFEITITISRK